MPTTSVENYLKAIYSAQQEEGERVKTKRIAESLEVSRPSVSGMLKSLSEEGLVDYQPYKGARLTDQGEKTALRVIRNHRLIEVFLVHVLGYSWDEVHDEAERLEHAVSDDLVSRIDAYLNHPRFDPHGDPIPTAEGQLERREMHHLSDMEAGDEALLERVMDQDPQVLRYLDRMGLRPGSELTIEEVLDFDGQMFLEVDGQEVVVSQRLATMMLVTPIEQGGPS